MRIAFLSWRDTPHELAGGSEVVVDRLADGLVSRGHHVELFHGGPSGEHLYTSRSAGGRYSQYTRVPLSYLRHAREVDVVVDVENGIPFFAPLWQRAPVVILVHHLHTAQWSMYYPRPIASLGRWLETRAVPVVYRRSPFVAVSKSTAAALELIGVDRTRTTTINPGIGFEPARPRPSSTPRFVILGRLVRHKRVELALSSWEAVRQITGGELVVVGDGPERSRLRALAGPDVRFTGWVDEAQKREELSRAWMLIHPAHHEGWGIVIMEAAAAGVPTVAFDVTGVRDSVADNVTGLLAGNDREFIANWVRLATDDELRRTMSAAAQTRAAPSTWERAVESFEALLVGTVRAPRRIGRRFESTR